MLPADPDQATGRTRGLLRLYYAATALFLALDFVLGLNLRVAFLDSFPVARLGYYGVLLACLVGMWYRPALTVPIATVESLVTLVALILGFGSRVLLATSPEGDAQAIAPDFPEILNFLLAGAAAYVAWWRGARDLERRLRGG
ncbi:MAG TPA: hypothetical protein VFY03_08260 [Woeseiaceae bacterium]|nr:hypothetical protein [Woeseiaceae bacterium]